MKARPFALRPRRKTTDRRLVLEQFEDRILLATYTVINNADTGTGSFRDAINQVNAGSGGDLIQFALPSGQTSINPASPLPAITASRVVIDGTTASGWTPGRPVVELNGSGLPANTAGLVLRGSNITVKGLVINRFPGAGGDAIQIAAGGGDLIVGNFIGTDVSGTVARPNARGIFINNVGGNTIGGTTLADRNVISGNTFTAVDLFAAGASRNLIQGNYLGVNANGNAKLGNGGSGVFINSGTANTIGGTSAGARNVISGNIEGIGLLGVGNLGTIIQGNYIGTDSTGNIGLGNTFNGITTNGGGANSIGGNGGVGGNVISANGRAGIQMQGTTATLNIIRGNSIGVGADGTTALGNATQGVWNFGGVNNFVGGLTPGDGNIIANNGSLFTNDGVFVDGGSGVLVASNSIYNNAALGVHVGNGSNDGITRPTITRAETAAGLINITGSFNGAAGSDYVVQFFGNKVADASGFGEGRTLIPPDANSTGITVTTNAFGVGNFNVRLPLPSGVVLGDFLTALLHRTAIGDTSEFSSNKQITVAPTTDLRVTMNPSTANPLLLTNFDYNVGVANLGPNDSTSSTTSVTLDPSFTVVSASAPYTLNGNTLVFDNGALASGSTASYTITVKPNSVTTTNSSATVVATEIDPGANNNKATSTVKVLPAVNLAISGSTPATSLVGSELTYILSISNTGPSVAQNAIVTYVVPSNVTFVSADLGSGGLVQTSTDPGTGVVTVTATTPSIPVGPSGNFNLKIVVVPNATGALSSTFSLAANEQDVDISNNTTKIDTQINPAIDLRASITPSASTVGANAPLSYQISVVNSGPSTASGTTVAVALDPSLTFVSSTLSGSYNPGTHVFSATIGALAANASSNFTIATTTTVSKQATTTVTVSNSPEVDPDGANDTAAADVDVAPSDISISGSADPSPSIIGSDLAYTFTVTNNGPYPAANVILSQTLPGSVQFNSSTPAGAVVNGTSLTLNLGTMAVNEVKTVVIHVTPSVSGPINTLASVASDQTDPNPSNNATTLSNVVSPADLSVSTNVGASSPIILDNGTIQVTVTNNGPAVATNVRLTDTLTGNFSLVSATSDLGTASIVDSNHVLLTIPTLASGASATLTITVNSGVAGAINSDAVVTLNEFDPTTDDHESKATLTYINTPGILQLSSSTASVSETGGSIIFTVNRTKGNLGAATVNYATTDITAIAGVNYVATSGTLSFGDGETSKTFAVPILHDGVITRNLTFGVSLSGNTSAALGTPSATEVTIINTDLDLVSPQVVSLLPVLTGKVITSFSIGFSEALEPNTASTSSNYSIFAADKKGVYSSVAVASATYNPSTNKVSVITAVPLAQGGFYKVVVNGTGSTGVQDIWGNVLDGAGNGGHDTNFVGYAGVGTSFSYLDSTGNLVSFKLTGGGSLSVSRFANGDAMQVQLNGLLGKARQVLSGSVKKAGLAGTGVTRIGSLTGIGTFGDVRVTMTTPPFYVKTISGFSASAVKGLLPKPVVVKAKAVPAGPMSRVSQR